MPELRMRSLLFVPADDARKMRRAIESAADMIIFDLEDAVADALKADARALLAQTLTEVRPAQVVVRINGGDTAEHLADLVTVAKVAPDFVMLPKCQGPADVARLAARLDVMEAMAGLRAGQIGILPLVSETAASLADLDYRGASARLAALVFAAEDLSADLGIAARGVAGAMNPMIADARRRVAYSAVQAGLRVIDTPHPNPRDEQGLRDETATAVELGYSGKLCIHPGQIPAVHEIFQPSPERLAWAQAVIAVFEGETDSGVTTVDGKMVDKAHLRLARKLSALASD